MELGHVKWSESVEGGEVKRAKELDITYKRNRSRRVSEV